MEIFGGFMVMMSILGFFLTVIWFVLPFVVFSVKGKVDHSLELLESIDARLASMESRLESISSPTSSPSAAYTADNTAASAATSPSDAD